MSSLGVGVPKTSRSARLATLVLMGLERNGRPTTAAPSANSQIQEFTVTGYTNIYTHYRLIFGPPVSGDRLQVGEVRLFGTVNNPVWTSASANQFTMQWLAVAGFSVQQRTNLTTGSWIAVTNVPALNGGTNSLSLPLDSNMKFFRLNEQ